MAWNKKSKKKIQMIAAGGVREREGDMCVRERERR